MSAEILLSCLDKVKPTGPSKWSARCPAHSDRSPSLNIREADDGTVLLHCFAGCSAHEVIESVGLQMTDLFPPRQPGIHNHRSKMPRIGWAETFDAIETELITVAIAWSDFSNGVPLSDEDALYLSRKADRLAEIIGEVRNGR